MSKLQRLMKIQAQALATLLSSEIPAGFPVARLMEAGKLDFAHGILLDGMLGLSERIGAEKYTVQVAGPDEMGLIAAGQAARPGTDHGGLAFLTTPERYAFSLLLSYYLLNRHLLEGMIHGTLGYFAPNGGLLLVSNNLELSSRLLRTHYGEQLLPDIYPVYKMKLDGTLEPMFQAHRHSSDNVPWFGFFRAYRRALPERIDRVPDVIVLDLLPIRHRGRIPEILHWARSVAPDARVLAVAPFGDGAVGNALTGSGLTLLPIGGAATREIRRIFHRSPVANPYPLTRCWNHAMDMDMTENRRKYTLYQITGSEAFEATLTRALTVINSAESKEEGLAFPFQRLYRLAWQMYSMVVPPVWLDQERRIHGYAGIREQIDRCGRAVPLTDHERRVYNTVLPVAVGLLQEAYEHLNSSSRPPKSRALFALLRRELGEGRRGLVLLPDRDSAALLPSWLRSNASWEEAWDEQVEVCTFDEYLVRLHSAGPVEQEESHADFVVVTSVLPRRHISLLHCHLPPNVYVIGYPREREVIQSQVVRAHADAKELSATWVAAFAAVVDPEAPPAKPILRSKSEDFYHLTLKDYRPKDQPLQQGALVSGLDLASLVSLVERMDDSDTDEEFEQEEAAERTRGLEWTDSDVGEKVPARQVTCDKGRVMFLVDGETCKALRSLESEMKDRTPDELNAGDYLILTRSAARRDLFQAVLEGVAQTPMMVYLRARLDEWRRMLERLRDKHRAEALNVRHLHELMLADIRAEKASIATAQSIRNWLVGKNWAVQKVGDVQAVCAAVGIKDAAVVGKRIHGAMRKLHSFHIEIGRKLTRMIQYQAALLVEGEAAPSDVITLDGGVQLPLTDMLEALEICQVATVDLRAWWQVPSWLSGRLLTLSDAAGLVQAGVISREDEVRGNTAEG